MTVSRAATWRDRNRSMMEVRSVRPKGRNSGLVAMALASSRCR
jgi:hypothetical protein